jgi:hypothetical protein
MERKNQTGRGGLNKGTDNTNKKDNKNAGNRQNSSVPSRGGGRGFASMDEDQQREIASKGGKASHGGGRKSGGSNLRGNGRK